MKKLQNIILGTAAIVLLTVTSCEKYLDINTNPNAPTSAPIQQVLTNVTVNVGFAGGSDMHRFTSLIIQQFAGQNAPGTQSREYARYQIQPTDVNNLYSTLFATQLQDIEYILKNSEGSPHYSGIAKILKAHIYSQAVDMWGDLPYTEAFKAPEINQPKLDKAEEIYKTIITVINEGITEVKATTSALSPSANETIFKGDRVKWEKFANTLKLRLFLRYSAKDPAFAKAQLDALIASNAPFMTSIADNFQMDFVDATASQNPIHQFENTRSDQFFPNKFLVDLMNSTSDPRRPTYFTDFPFGSGTYKGATPLDAQSFAFSRMHTYLRGELKRPLVPDAQGRIPSNPANNTAYTGAAPIRLLTFAEYNFIRAEHALRYGAGAAAAMPFYQAGIRASMTMAGVSAANQDAYILANGLLNGLNLEANVAKIITQKYIANYGVALEPWNDWRRTGYPVLVPVDASIAAEKAIPRSLFYPESEVASNPNFIQKPNQLVRIFWDTRP
ncbi:MAG TPA: SusD/RagB family nutrient-binding outer membrane lipoprotein [Sphingobacteriaceae bacterium]|nr:SusD/RagB family nutrient-binding outer membrane lipoprotein [Sphingobacteriaceae bacterium]